MIRWWPCGRPVSPTPARGREQRAVATERHDKVGVEVERRIVIIDIKLRDDIGMPSNALLQIAELRRIGGAAAIDQQRNTLARC